LSNINSADFSLVDEYINDAGHVTCVQPMTVMPYLCRCRFLKILEVIILEPSSSFKKFLPTVLDICLNHICPVLHQVSDLSHW